MTLQGILQHSCADPRSDCYNSWHGILSAAIQHLMTDVGYRQQLAEAGFTRVRYQFALEVGIANLERRFMADAPSK